ncbi:hook-length control protein FliK [Austwickia chelonae]|uniref:Flagellar hook-length control protein-like C-terminal domain-containing protein n=1 Tax=Austwickia chelonae NBRC 105200 TaxID=1184607 RepID=K6VQV9_9MICO|nr:flagellar hook-length control protein FliK [Austwickia chelonae]GAB77755.1 hypothetical protein AUCHE_06_00270 [Austwickia chelonae NBRC 105200]SEV88882.1 hook-length control protein FliK [Austwickia chelonae]
MTIRVNTEKPSLMPVEGYRLPEQTAGGESFAKVLRSRQRVGDLPAPQTRPAADRPMPVRPGAPGAGGTDRITSGSRETPGAPTTTTTSGEPVEGADAGLGQAGDASAVPVADPMVPTAEAQSAAVVTAELAVMLRQQSLLGRTVTSPGEQTTPAAGAVAPTVGVTPGAPAEVPMAPVNQPLGGQHTAIPGGDAASAPQTPGPTLVPGVPADEPPTVAATPPQPPAGAPPMPPAAASPAPAFPVADTTRSTGPLPYEEPAPTALQATAPPFPAPPSAVAAPPAGTPATPGLPVSDGPAPTAEFGPVPPPSGPATAARPENTTDEGAPSATTPGPAMAPDPSRTQPQATGRNAATVEGQHPEGTTTLPPTGTSSVPATSLPDPATARGGAEESSVTGAPTRLTPTARPITDPSAGYLSSDRDPLLTPPPSATDVRPLAGAKDPARPDPATAPPTDRPTTPTPPPSATPPVVQSPHAPAVTAASHHAPAQAAAPPAPVHSQLLTAIAPVIQRRDGSYNVELQLDPASLGRVKVTVTMQAGEISVQMQAADSGARDMLRQNMDQLRDQLADAGFGRTSVDVGDGSRQAWQDPRGQQPRDPSGHTSTRIDRTGTPLPGDRPAASETTDGSGPLDLQL